MRTLLTYALMVGGPLAGLLLILHFGNSLDAPAAVGGRWQVVEDGSEVVIEQSGRYLRGRVEAEPFEALIEPRECDQLVHVERGRCAGMRALLRPTHDGWHVNLTGSDCLGAESRTFTLARAE